MALGSDLKRLNIRVRPEMHEWLVNNAAARGLTLNAMVILSLESYMSQQMVLPHLNKIMDELDKKKELDITLEEYQEFQKKLSAFESSAKDSSE